MNESSNELIWACLDGNSSPEEEGALCREILSDGGIADAFAEQARMHASLDAYFNEYDAASFAPKSKKTKLHSLILEFILLTPTTICYKYTKFKWLSQY